MRLLLAPNAFKGSLSATQAAAAMAAGVRFAAPEIECDLFPVADGGNGTMTLLTQGLGGVLSWVKTVNAWGADRTAAFGWVETTQTAIIGLSEASGWQDIEPSRQSVLRADTFGTGLLVKAALEKGARRLLICLGGSATNDGGTGLLRALGLRFLDHSGAEIVVLPSGLVDLHKLDDSLLDQRFLQADIRLLCDVHTPLLGPKGATALFSAQKGAGEKEQLLLENLLTLWQSKIRQKKNTAVDTLPFGGAAGGTAAGLMGFTSAQPVAGIAYFLKVLGFDSRLAGADAVLTGEGSLDAQTWEGKGPFEVAKRAKGQNVPAFGFAGKISIDKGQHTYFDALININAGQDRSQDPMAMAGFRLEMAVAKFIRSRRTGNR